MIVGDIVVLSWAISKENAFLCPRIKLAMIVAMDMDKSC